MMYDFDPLYSAYPTVRNQTLKYIANDHKDVYKHNMKDPYWSEMLLSCGWYNKKIQYTFNSHGFRSDEFEKPETPSVIFLGCSYTLGVGLPIENSFTHLVSKELGLKNYNLGISGGGADSSFRIGSHWIPKLKPTMVIFANIFKDRCEYVKKYKVCEQKMGPFSANDVHIKYSHSHWNLNNLKNLYALKFICDREKIPLYNITEFERLDFARDLMHPGIISNEQVAEDILTQIQNRGEYNGI